MAKCIRCGQRGLILKVSDDGLCVDCLSKALSSERKQKEELEASITPEMRDLRALQSLIEEANKTLSNTKNQIAELEGQLNSRKIVLSDLQKQIISAEDIVELESFSMYVPKYPLSYSEEYKARLDALRAKQKEMIKQKTATTVPQNWTVNGSTAEGRKMVADNVKLFLRSFNNECDAACDSVRFNTFDRCLQRITKSFETINKLGRVTNVAIKRQYLELKIEELHLCLEYALKKQEEKEAQRALRAEQREQAKLEKEIAEARKAAEKEKAHYSQALSKLDAQIENCIHPDMLKEYQVKRSELVEMLETIQSKLEDIDYRQSNQRAGYVYVISNIGAFGEGIYKIGMTRRLDPMERIDELGDASVPFYFDIHAMIFSDDAPKLEAALHEAFSDRRVNKINKRREYFRVSLDEIKEVVRKHHDKTVEFVDVPIAEQYRQSALI